MKKIIISSMICTFVLSYFIIPINVSAKTISDFEAEVKKYTAELEEKQAKIAKNDAEVAEIKKRITSIQGQIRQTENEITSLQNEIDASNKKIDEKGKESKKIIEYYQLSSGENSYLQYIFGATSITDMIYRISMAEQLTEYNDNIMKELNALIKKNKTQQQQLKTKTTELNNLEKELKSEQARINADTASIRAGMPTVQQQIKAAKEQLTYYKKLGCGFNEDIQACDYRVNQKNAASGGSGSVPSTNGFFRPIQYGYISQSWNKSHMGLDMSSSNKTIEIHPIASGLVTAVYWDNCSSANCYYGCNGKARVIKVKHNYNGRYIYSTYAHMSSWNVSEGQYVTPDTVLGKMGTTGCSTGNHLHLEVNTCDWVSVGGGCTWSQYVANAKNPANYVEFPGSWTNR